MAVYKERPQSWEAMQMGSTPQVAQDVYEWAVSKVGEFDWDLVTEDSWPTTGVNIDLTTGKLMCANLDGLVPANATDYLWYAKEQGVIWPVVKEDFEAKYELLTTPAQQTLGVTK